MGEVESTNYAGKDRRINGARLKLSVRDWIALISLAITLILLIGNLKWTVAANSKNIEEHTVKINIIERDLGTIKGDVSYIRGWIEKK